MKCFLSWVQLVLGANPCDPLCPMKRVMTSWRIRRGLEVKRRAVARGVAAEKTCRGVKERVDGVEEWGQLVCLFELPLEQTGILPMPEL
jgi:hypothetical protein